LSYNWSQVNGTPVTLSNPHSTTPTFTAPQEPSHSQETLSFRLDVDDGLGGRGAAEVAITALYVDAPPACGLAQALLALLWPPHHGLVAVAIGGVSDPDNDQITLAVTGVV
jgi:hypothetical protein